MGLMKSCWGCFPVTGVCEPALGNFLGYRYQFLLICNSSERFHGEGVNTSVYGKGFFLHIYENFSHIAHHHAVLSGSLLKTGSIYAICRRGRAVLVAELQMGQSLCETAEHP
jgi:hypothetical protein